MKIFLIGFMGSGKTTVGKKLAKLLEYTFIDMDQFIEEEEGREIPKIFGDEGEDYFRKVENTVLQNLLNKKNVVVATGGGAPCFHNNIDLMNEQSITIYLRINPKAFVSRVYDPNTNRPLLKGKSKEELETFAENTLAMREPYYSQAKFTVDAITKGPEEVARKISQLLKT